MIWSIIPLAFAGLLVAVWRWDWFVPIVQSRASAALGRSVRIGHLHVGLGRIIQVTADGVTVGNPPKWPSSDPPLASVEKLTVQVDVWDYIRGHGLDLPLIAIEKPQVYAAETADGASNFKFSFGGGGKTQPPKIGALRIDDGEAHIVMAKLKSDFHAKLSTRGQGEAARLIVDAEGTYAAQPIDAHLTGGALLSLRDAAKPWPVDLTIANGQDRGSA